MLERLVEQFDALDDPRCPGKIAYPLVDVLVIAVCAVIAGAETFEDVALYGRCKERWLRAFLALPHGIPSHDTFRRVLMLVDPDAFEQAFLGWVCAAFPPAAAPGVHQAPEQVAVDGKTVRHAFDRKRTRSPLHLVSAYATERGLVLAQCAADDKGGEPGTLPQLLDGLDVRGCRVSLDALACRPDVAQQIRAKGADYLLTRKGSSRPTRGERTPKSPRGSRRTSSIARQRAGLLNWRPASTRSTRATAASCAAACSPGRTSARSPRCAIGRGSTSSWPARRSAGSTARAWSPPSGDTT